MTGFTQLSQYGMVALLAAFILLHAMLIMNMITSIVLRRHLHTALITAVMVPVAFDLTSLLELNITKNSETALTPSAVSTIIDTIPYQMHILLFLLAFGLSIYLFTDANRYRKAQIAVHSIKSALENLPTGLAFGSEDGSLLLSNHRMHELSLSLTGKDLQNGHELWRDIERLSKTNICVMHGQSPAFNIDGKTVWQFSKSDLSINEHNSYQIKASDITHLHGLYADLETLNARLHAQRIRQNILLYGLERNTAEQEALDMKVRVHDNFGSLLVTLKKLVRESPDVHIMDDTFDAWSDLNHKISHFLRPQSEDDLTINEVLSLARQLGCQVDITGALPSDKAQRDLIVLAISEMLKNAAVHAKADRVSVSVRQDSLSYFAEIINHDKNPPDVIIEGGGLSGLRRKIEQSAGRMSIVIANGVCMGILLPK